MKKQLGHYEIVAEIGRGGMGVVYKGYESALARYVAIKELSPALSHDPVIVARFLREARSMALLNDPHIIQIYSIGQENDEPFFVMEFVDGTSLATLIKRDGRLESDDALKIVHQTAQGLSTAHDHGVIHRDIKPANLMINQRGQVKIADFGIALANHDMSDKLTSAGDVVGTAAYLSPEVMQGHPVDPRSEVYAVGVVLFEMLTGRTPFSDSNAYKLMHDVVETEAPDVREFNPAIDSETAAILERMLAKDPADRYQSMHELIADLETLPLINRGGPIKVIISPPAGTTGTIVGLTTPMTPGSRPRIPTPPPNVSQRQSTITPVLTTVTSPTSGNPMQEASSGAIADPAPGSSLKFRWSPLIMSLLMFLAGVTWAVRGQISEIFGSAPTHAEATTSAIPASASSTTSPGMAMPSQVESKTPVAAYVEAVVVTLLGMAAMGFWFGVHRRRRVEAEAGIHALANMKWRDCIRLILEVLGRDGYKEAPTPQQSGDGGTEFLLLRGNERVLLGFKLGSTYHINEASVREFAKGIEMQGATTGILLTLGSIESSALMIAKRNSVELIDGATIWPKVRPFIPANVLDHVRLQVATQTRNGLWMGFACSLLVGMGIFLFASHLSPQADVAAASRTIAATPTIRSTPPPLPVDAIAIKKSIAEAQARRAEVARLTPAQLVERRSKAVGEVSTIAQVAHAKWQTESTLELNLKLSDGVDSSLIAEVCRILTQYEELRLTRLQIDPLDNTNGSVRWGQCQ